MWVSGSEKCVRWKLGAWDRVQCTRECIKVAKYINELITIIYRYYCDFSVLSQCSLLHGDCSYLFEWNDRYRNVYKHTKFRKEKFENAIRLFCVGRPFYNRSFFVGHTPNIYKIIFPWKSIIMKMLANVFFSLAQKNTFNTIKVTPKKALQLI